MLTRILITAAILMALVILPGCNRDKGGSGKAPVKTGKAMEGATAPDFTVTDLEGKSVKLSDLRGKVVMVNFWATWCPPCIEEIPSMVKLNRNMAGKPFVMLAISIDSDGKEGVGSFLKKSGHQLPAFLDKDETISQLYGTTGVPETFIIDPQGVIQKKVVGGLDWSTPEVAAYLDKLARK